MVNVKISEARPHPADFTLGTLLLILNLLLLFSVVERMEAHGAPRHGFASAVCRLPGRDGLSVYFQRVIN